MPSWKGVKETGKNNQKEVLAHGKDWFLKEKFFGGEGTLKGGREDVVGK